MTGDAAAQDAQNKPQGRMTALKTVGNFLLGVFLEKEHPPSAADASYRMRILSVFAISFVVLGHINFQVSMPITLQEILTFQGWFPYYSFHLPLFLFISGYFFKDLPQDRTCFLALLRYIGKKIVKFLIPYYIFSGLLLWFNGYIRTQGFTFGESFSLISWLASPWVRPYAISFSTPLWYLPALFITEICLLLLRWIFGLVFRRSLLREILALLVTLAAGVWAAYYNKTAAPSATVLVYLRSALMLFFIQVGVMYRKHLEKYDLLKSPWYFLIVFVAQFFLIVQFGKSNTVMNPGLYELTYFGETGTVYFLGGLTGILLWLRISAIIASQPRRSKFITFVGKNTKYIMALHIFSWFLFNTLLYNLYTKKIKLFLLTDFSTRWYHSFLYYCNTTSPRAVLLYYAVGMGLPLLVAFLAQTLFRLLRFILRLLLCRFRRKDVPKETGTALPG